MLPITDKRKAVLASMWFRLEQVKQCRKIDPSSVAFQRPARNGPKSRRANPARNRRGTKAVGAVVASLRRAPGAFVDVRRVRFDRKVPVMLAFFWCH